MTLPNMPDDCSSREFLRVAGGYGAAPAGDSPAGGLDVDHAGNAATDGDLTVRGILATGSTPQDLTNAAGQVLGARIALASVGNAQMAAAAIATAQLADDAVTPAKVDSTKVFELGGLKLLDPWVGLVHQSSTGQFTIATDSGTIRIASSNTASQLVECFRISAVPGTPAAAEFRVYDPGTTNIKHQLRGDGYAYHAGDLYVGGNVSAQSFTDRSPVYVGGRALEILKAVRSLCGTEGTSSRCPGDQDWAEVDHDTLGPMRAERTMDDKVLVERDLNIQIQILSAAVLELVTRLEALEVN
ncbi:MAG: hypothetical protein HYV27_01240 [Candidatus Hydrogenedentes bacterium]|nr:hypothetical protein [Candidatus Hydrogenedentota bacterium]